MCLGGCGGDLWLARGGMGGGVTVIVFECGNIEKMDAMWAELDQATLGLMSGWGSDRRGAAAPAGRAQVQRPRPRPQSTYPALHAARYVSETRNFIGLLQTNTSMINQERQPQSVITSNID